MGMTIQYRMGVPHDLDKICELIEAAKVTMNKNDIYQWDEIYPIREDFQIDIENKTLYVACLSDKICGVYTISTECDGEYDKCRWENEKNTACIIHRLCVDPMFQNKGVGRDMLNHIEKQLYELGYRSVRLDVFSQNPYALAMYEKNGYIRRGYADWRKGRFYLMEKSIE